MRCAIIAHVAPAMAAMTAARLPSRPAMRLGTLVSINLAQYAPYFERRHTIKASRTFALSQRSIHHPSLQVDPSTDSAASSADAAEARRVAEFRAARLQRGVAKQREAATYQYAAIAASVGMLSLAIVATYCRFAWHTSADGEPAWLEMAATLLLVFGGVAGMEMYARFAHKVRHGPDAPGWLLVSHNDTMWPKLQRLWRYLPCGDMWFSGRPYQSCRPRCSILAGNMLRQSPTRHTVHLQFTSPLPDCLDLPST